MTANPFTEPVTFEEFRKETLKPAAGEEQPAQSKGLNEKQLQAQLDKSARILAGFTPPERRG